MIKVTSCHMECNHFKLDYSLMPAVALQDHHYGYHIFVMILSLLGAGAEAIAQKIVYGKVKFTKIQSDRSM